MYLGLALEAFGSVATEVILKPSYTAAPSLLLSQAERHLL